MLKYFRKSQAVSTEIKKDFKKKNYSGRLVRKKPYITAANCQKRLTCAQNVPKQARRVLGACNLVRRDKKFLFGPDGRQYVWRKPERTFKRKNLLPTIKTHGWFSDDVPMYDCKWCVKFTYNKWDYGLISDTRFRAVRSMSLNINRKNIRTKTTRKLYHDTHPRHLLIQHSPDFRSSLVWYLQKKMKVRARSTQWFVRYVV